MSTLPLYYVVDCNLAGPFQVHLFQREAEALSCYRRLFDEIVPDVPLRIPAGKSFSDPDVGFHNGLLRFVWRGEGPLSWNLSPRHLRERCPLEPSEPPAERHPYQ